MTDTTLAPTASGLKGLIQSLNALAGRLMPYDLVAIAARFFVAATFWLSARTKVDGFAIKDQTYFLFENIYNLPLINSSFAAVAATIAEHVLPVLLVLGIVSRFGAAGLLVMTAVIQIFVFPEAWNLHGLWAASLLVVISMGPGRFSLDHVLGFERKT